MTLLATGFVSCNRSGADRLVPFPEFLRAAHFGPVEEVHAATQFPRDLVDLEFLLEPLEGDADWLAFSNHDPNTHLCAS